MPPGVLRVIGIACLLSNIGIGIWFASTDASMTQRVFMMGLLGLLVAAGLLCLATASQMTMRQRRAQAMAQQTSVPQASPGDAPVDGPAASVEAPPSGDEPA